MRGTKGDLKVESLSDIPGRFAGLKDAFFRKRDAVEAVKYKVEKSELINDYVVMKLNGVNSFDDASSFVGAEVLVPESEKASLPVGTYFVDSLIGMSVKDLNGNKIGVVADVLSNSVQSVLSIETENGSEFNLPFVKEFVRNVDLDEKEIRVELIEGIVPEAKIEGGVDEN